jgi:hypothetical protein
MPEPHEPVQPVQFFARPMPTGGGLRNQQPTGQKPDENTTPGWTAEPRFAAFREAYSYATGHFSVAAPAFAKVTREEAFRIWHCIQLGMEKQGAPTDAHQRPPVDRRRTEGDPDGQ